MRPEKATIVDDLSKRLNQSPFLIVTEYTGMNVRQFSELRVRLAGAGASCKVV
ncbi:MAG TPA: 50S ribosomal protein L10, partial [Chthoniobacterales bacterium]|nr:50S ribosomal protein L10 [Chthoniobacterales bacterium]